MRKLLFLFAAGLLTMTSCKKPEVNVYIDNEPYDYNSKVPVSFGTINGISSYNVSGKSASSAKVDLDAWTHKHLDPADYNFIIYDSALAVDTRIESQTVGADGILTTEAQADLTDGDDYSVAFRLSSTRPGTSFDSFHFKDVERVEFTAVTSETVDVPLEPVQGLITFDWNVPDESYCSFVSC